jgi:hypothetical protein
MIQVFVKTCIVVMLAVAYGFLIYVLWLGTGWVGVLVWASVSVVTIAMARRIL